MYRKVLILLFSAMLLSGCSSGESAVSAGADNKEGMLNISAIDAPASNKKEYKAQYRDLSTEVELSAVKENPFSYSVYAPECVGTLIISEFSVEDGQLVKDGDKLFTLTRSFDKIKRKEKEIEYQRALEDYQAKCSEYEESIAEAKKIAAENPEDESLSLKVDQIEYEYNTFMDSETAKINTIKAVVDEYAEIEKKPQIEITADRDGQFLLATTSSSISSGGLLAYIVDVDQVIYKVASNYENLDTDEIVSMTSESGEIIVGRVISNEAELEKTKSGGAIIQVISVNGNDQYDSLYLPEQVSFKINPVHWKNILTIETKAIQKDSTGAEYVNKLLDNGKTERVYINRYLEIDNYTWVVRGLEEGDICLTE